MLNLTQKILAILILIVPTVLVILVLVSQTVQIFLPQQSKNIDQISESKIKTNPDIEEVNWGFASQEPIQK
jgi:hypothetical protein